MRTDLGFNRLTKLVRGKFLESQGYIINAELLVRNRTSSNIVFPLFVQRKWKFPRACCLVIVSEYDDVIN
jgi:hypothetical protein